MAGDDDAERLAAIVRDAAAAQQCLHLEGSGSKRFLIPAPVGTPLALTGHRGVVDYHPEELVLTARAGTGLQEITAVLAERGQVLPFEPPQFGGGGTLGGAVAAGVSGPGRPWYGALRDAVLGVEMLNGLGERLRFGGQVMKNVAGYDIARLMCGSWGTLGVLLSVSVRTRPLPESERTLVFALDRDAALARVVELGRRPLPVTATCHDNRRLMVRLSGTVAEVDAAAASLGGEAGDGGVWFSLRDREGEFFELGEGEALWCLALPFAAPFPPLPGRWLTEWGGGRRWLVTPAPEATVRDVAAAAGGFATPQASGPFTGLAPEVMRYHARIRAAFDPHRVFDPCEARS